MSLYESIQAHSWVFTDVELNSLKVPNPVHKLSEGEVVLLANRSARFIYVFNKYWAAMDLFNRVGLVLHEAIYSLLPPQNILLSNGEHTLRQNGRRARQILAVLSGMKSLQSLYEMGLSTVIDPFELPMLGDSRLPPFKVTSTFFTRGGKFQRTLVPKDRLALVGPAVYRLAVKDPEVVVDFPISAMEVPDRDGIQKKAMEDLLKAPCEALSAKMDTEFQVEMVFPVGEKGQEQSYELRVASYQEHDELKQYIQFNPLTETKSQIAWIGSSNLFFDIASVAGKSVPDLLSKKKTETSEVVAVCVRYLSGVVGRRSFYYPATYPSDPNQRYGH